MPENHRHPTIVFAADSVFAASFLFFDALVSIFRPLKDHFCKFLLIFFRNISKICLYIRCICVLIVFGFAFGALSFDFSLCCLEKCQNYLLDYIGHLSTIDGLPLNFKLY